MPKQRSWADKVRTGKAHQVKPAPMSFAGMKVGEIMLVPSPQIVDKFIRAIPKGKCMDVATMRKKLARKYKAEVTCPITMGIQMRIVAEAAYEAYAAGTKLADVAPVWRVLDEDAPTAKKLSCGTAFIAEQRAREGL